ncbi:MAG: hypothetical protein V7641_3404, partial [Blastocatellia bacterium]
MRKTCLLLLFVIALAAPAMMQFRVADANVRQANAPEISAAQAAILGLPNFDIRQEVASLQVLSARQAPSNGDAVSVRLNAINTFSVALASQTRTDLRYEMNEAGVPKTLFNLAGPLSLPQTGAADQIARDFLNRHGDLFGLTRRDVRRLKLEGEDQDQGITFLHYRQTIDGIDVFQGQVQIAVGAAGEVLSVMEGLLLPGSRADATPTLTEDDALTAAFQYSGRQATNRLETLTTRAARGDRATYRNPLGADFDDVLSDLRVMRVGDRTVLAWHAYVDAGPNEWYEICVDAHTGALLFRYNLYADAAQGTVFTQNPLTARTLESFVGDTTINTAAGWMGTSTVTTGNNVEAYLDTDANNAPDPNNTTGLSNGHASAANQ